MMQDEGGTKGARTRRRLVYAAIDLFQRNGYAATGLAEIVASAEAPKGSFYFHFPAGKPELGVHAVREASRLMVALFESVASSAKDAASAVTDLAAVLGASLQGSGFVAGCPIATVALETTPQDVDLSAAITEEFARWRSVLADRFVADGVPRPKASALATAVLCGLEGALVVARAERSTAALDETAAELAALVRAAVERAVAT